MSELPKWGREIIKVLAQFGEPMTSYAISKKIGKAYASAVQEAIERKDGLDEMGFVRLFEVDEWRTLKTRRKYILSPIGMLLYIIFEENTQSDIISFIEIYKKFYPHPFFESWNHIHNLMKNDKERRELYIAISSAIEYALKFYSTENWGNRLMWDTIKYKQSYIKEYDGWVVRDYGAIERDFFNFFTFRFFEITEKLMMHRIDEKVREIINSALEWRFKKLMGSIRYVEKLSTSYGIKLDKSLL